MHLADALGLDGRALVAFVGAGGKKTAMRRLVRTARARDRTVGYTTTTHTPPPPDLPLVVTGSDDVLSALEPVETPVAFASERVADPDRADAKVRGYDAATVADVFESRRFDWLLVKADGARRREFKAPGPAEPVVPPAATHVVAVASVRAIGEPLAAETVHRPERVAAITDTAVGEPVTAATVGAVLASDDGGLKGVPADARAVPVVNKADTPALRDRARDAVTVAIERSSRIEYGLVTSFEEEFCEVVGR